MPADASTTPAGVAVRDLVVRRGNVLAVDGLSFDAEPGQVTALLGPNGAGKTTTIEVCEGFLAPDAGEVRVLGMSPVADHSRLVRRMGVMLQQGGVYPGIRVAEAVRLHCAFHDRAEDPDALVALVGLTSRRRATWRQLSGGEQQRLSFALALAGRPDVVFLDEPTASVDVAGRRSVREVIRSLADRGCCVVLTTHELEEAERLADRVVIVDHGRVVAAGSPAELTRSMRAEELRFGARGGLDVASLGASTGALVREVTAGEYVVDAPPSPALVAAVTAWLAEHDVPLADLRAGRRRLEDVYLALTNETSVAAEARHARRRTRRARQQGSGRPTEGGDR